VKISRKNEIIIRHKQFELHMRIIEVFLLKLALLLRESGYFLNKIFIYSVKFKLNSNSLYMKMGES